MARDLARERNEQDGFQQYPHSKKQKDAITCVLRILTKLHLSRDKFGKIFSKKDHRSAKLNSRKIFAHHQDYIFAPHLQHNVNNGNRKDKVKLKLIRRLRPSLHDHGLPLPRVESLRRVTLLQSNVYKHLHVNSSQARSVPLAG